MTRRPAAFRERAPRMREDALPDHGNEFAVIDGGGRPGITGDERAELTGLTRADGELRSANDVSANDVSTTASASLAAGAGRSPTR